MEQMNYNLLFRWFVGLGVDDPVWVPTVFTKNRDRLLTTEMSRKVMAAILAHRDVAPLLSDDHFSVDGTLVKAWASMKASSPERRMPRPMTIRALLPDQTPMPLIQPRRPPPRPIRCPAANAIAVMPTSTSGARDGRMPPTARSPIRMHGSTRSRPEPGRCCASSGMR